MAPASTSCTHLMGDVRPRLADVATHFAHDANVVVAVEKVVLVLPRSRASSCAVRRLVSLEGGIAQHHNEPLAVLVVGGDRRVLLRDKLGQLGRRHRLGSCRLNGHVSAIQHVW